MGEVLGRWNGYWGDKVVAVRLEVLGKGEDVEEEVVEKGEKDEGCERGGCEGDEELWEGE